MKFPFFKKNKTPTVAKRDRVPIKEKLAYGSGGLVNPVIIAAPNWMLLFYVQAFQVSAGIITTAAGICRAWDAINDPIIGSLSDNCRSRFGRRRPFIFVGAILFGLTFPALWYVNPEWSDLGKFAYILGAGLLFYTTSSIWALPYLSLATEMSPDTNERTRLFGIVTYFSYVAGMLNNWLPKLIALGLFAGPLLVNGEPNLAQGLKSISWIIAGMIILAGILPAIFCHERYFDKGLTKKQERVPLIKSVRQTASCQPFWILVGILLTQVVGALLVQGLGFFVSRFYVCEGDYGLAATIFGVAGTIGLVLAVFSVWFWVWLAETIGKAKTVGIVIICGIWAKFSVYLFYTPENPWLMLIPALFFSFQGAAFWMIVPSMLGDIIDYDELKNGTRREGNFNAVFHFINKGAATFSMIASGWIMVGIGFDETTATQTAEVSKSLLNWFVFLPIVVWGISLFLISMYWITPEKAREIRAELEARRGEV